MSERLKIQAYLDGSWVDLTGYTIPNWGTDEILAETRLGSFSAQPIVFSLEDRDSTPQPNYWLQRMASSAQPVNVKVSRAYGDTEPPQYRVVMLLPLKQGLKQ